MPDSHRLPCYVLADTQDVYQYQATMSKLEVLRDRPTEVSMIGMITIVNLQEHPDDRIVQCRPSKRRSVSERGERSILQND